MEFKKPKIVYNDGFDKLKEYEHLTKMKIYDRGLYNPEPYKTNQDLINKFKELKAYISSHRHDVVGKLFSASGEYIREVKLNECASFKRGCDTYTDTTTYSRPEKVNAYYDMYSGFKFKLKDNHLYNWFSTEEREVFNAPTPQQLDDEGYITLTKDMKTYMIVNYGTDLIQQEMKDVYCSTNGRYIKYKGKNYYIKEDITGEVREMEK